MVTETLFAPALLKLTAPVNALLCVKVIGLVPALKLEVPGTVNAPVCVIAPPAVADKLPPLVKVAAGNAIAELGNVTVKLRRLLKPVKLGNAAAALTLLIFTSRILSKVPANTGAVLPRLFACVNKISEFRAVAAKVSVPPVAVSTPVCVILPPAVKVKFCPTVDAPSTKAMPFVTATALAPLLLNITAPVNALVCVKVIGFVPTVKLEVPATVKAPVCVSAPVAITIKFLPTEEVPSTNALPLVTAASLAPVVLTLTAPVNALLDVNVIGFAPALKLEVPATVNTPVCVIAPVAVAAKLPTFEAANAKAVLLVILARLPTPLLLKVTAPVNTLLNVKVIAFAPAVKLDVPGTVKIPVCVIAPVALAVKFCPTDEVPNTKARPLLMETLFAPELLRLTAPVNAFAWVNVIGLAPTLKLDVPDTVNAPVCVSAPVAVTVRLLPTDEVSSTRAAALLREILLTPVLFTLTAPVNTLFNVRVIGLPPALKFDVPGTVKIPACVIAPPASATKLPPLVKVIAGKAIAALLKVTVKLRKLVKPAKLGRVAPTLVLRKLTSRIFATVPANTGAAPRLFACDNKISEAGAVTAKLVVPPVAVNAPVWVMLPPDVIVKFCPTLDGPSIVAILLVSETLFAPLLLKLTAPVSTFAWVNVIACAPAVKLEVPGTVATPVWVILPPAVTDKVPVPPKVTVGKDIAAFGKLTVKSTAPLIVPPNTIDPVPVPPMVEVLASVIGLFTVMFAPLRVNPPAPLTPALFNVIVLVLPSVAALKFKSKAAPVVMPMLLEAPSALALVKLKIPDATVVAPL